MKKLIILFAAAAMLSACETYGKNEEQGGGERVRIETPDQDAA